MYKYPYTLGSIGKNYFLTFFFAIAAISLTACGGSGGGDSSGNSSDVDNVRNRVIAWYPIGNSANDPQNFDVGRGIPESGWSHFVNNVVIPQTSSRGLNRVMLHNPFGVIDGERWQLDQFLRARDRGLDGLTQDFVSAWRPVTSGGTEVLAFIGAPRDDPDSQQILNTQGEDAFTNRAMQAIAPILQAGMSLAYDAIAPALQDSADFRLTQRNQQMGTKVYIEATPPATHAWWFDFPVITREDTYQSRLRDSGFASRNDLTGEVLRIADISPQFVRNNPGVWPPVICRIIAEGDTAIVEDHLLEDPQRTIEGLAECAAALQ